MANEKTVLSISSPTPQWANWIFRSVLVIATALNTAIVNAPGISEAMQLHIVYWSGLVATIVWGLSRVLGVKVDDVKPQAFTRGPGDVLPPPPPTGGKP